MRVAGIGRFCHPYAEVADGSHPIDQLQRDGATLAFCDAAQRKRLPCALHRAVVEGLELSSPELHRILFRVGIGPGDADGVHINLCAEVDHHPLGMKGVVLAGEGFGEIWIALPIGVNIAVGEA